MITRITDFGQGLWNTDAIVASVCARLSKVYMDVHNREEVDCFVVQSDRTKSWILLCEG